MSFETPENMDKCCNTCRWNEPFKRYINRAPRHKEKREDMDYDD